MSALVRWGVMWHSRNNRYGVREFLVHHKGIPVLFCTRKDARAFVKEKHFLLLRGVRPDLREEPHGWRLPRPVKVRMLAITTWDGKKVTDGKE